MSDNGYLCSNRSQDKIETEWNVEKIFKPENMKYEGDNRTHHYWRAWNSSVDSSLILSQSLQYLDFSNAFLWMIVILLWFSSSSKILT